MATSSSRSALSWDIASQGASVSEARANLKEALELFYEAGFGRRDSASAA